MAAIPRRKAKTPRTNPLDVAPATERQYADCVAAEAQVWARPPGAFLPREPCRWTVSTRASARGCLGARESLAPKGVDSDSIAIDQPSADM